MKTILKTLIPFTLFAALIISGCGSNEKGDDSAPNTETKTEMVQTLSLKAQLDARRAESVSRMPVEMRNLFQSATANLKAKHIADNALGIGDIAPEFTLPNAVGEEVKLSDALRSGPVVLVWYRGGWCPYCNLELAAYRDLYPKFKEAGATVFAISPEQPDSSLSTKQKHQLEFEVLSDNDNSVAREYGLVFELEPKLADAYSQFINLEAYNQNDKNELPIPATYVIDQDGSIVYGFADEDYTIRAEPSKVLDAVKSIKSSKIGY